MQPNKPETSIQKSKPSNSFSKSEYSALLEFRKNLPIAKHHNEIIEMIKKSKVTIISGDTGSGKSTQIPQYIYETKLNDNKIIGVTQPRRVAAITLAQRVASEVLIMNLIYIMKFCYEAK